MDITIVLPPEIQEMIIMKCSPCTMLMCGRVCVLWRHFTLSLHHNTDILKDLVNVCNTDPGNHLLNWYVTNTSWNARRSSALTTEVVKFGQPHVFRYLHSAKFDFLDTYLMFLAAKIGNAAMVDCLYDIICSCKQACLGAVRGGHIDMFQKYSRLTGPLNIELDYVNYRYPAMVELVRPYLKKPDDELTSVLSSGRDDGEKICAIAWLVGKGMFKPKRTYCGLAAQSGSIALLELLLDLGCTIEHVHSVAIRRNHFHIIQWLYEHDREPRLGNVLTMIKRNRLQMLQYCVEKGHVLKSAYIQHAIYFGQYATVDYLCSQNCPVPNDVTIPKIKNHNSAKIVLRLHEYGVYVPSKKIQQALSILNYQKHI
jgi:hypothetical protein